MCRLAILALFSVAMVSVYGQDTPPPFLRNATPDQLKSFQQMIQSNGHLTETAMGAKIQEWVDQQGGKVAADWKDFQEFIKGQQGKSEAAHQTAISSFSPEAKKADAELTAISNDASLSIKAKGDKIQAYLTTLPANVKAELEKAQGQ